MLLDTRCPICRRLGGAPCAECVELFTPLGELGPPRGLDALHAAFAYQDAARPLVTGLKYRDQRAATSWIAGAMAGIAPPVPHGAVLTWAPTSAARRRRRGFDQAELLARAVSRRLGVPARRLLLRRDGQAQTGRGAGERWSGQVRFGAVRRSPPVVVLVDDVVTTGATLSAAAGALRSAGAARVIGLVAAATPPPGRPTR